MNKEIVNEYADLKMKIKEMEARINELNPLILEDLVKEGENAVLPIAGKGSFCFYLKRTWKFKKNILDAEEQIKKMKKEAQAKGEADYDETPILKFDIEK